MEKFNYFGIVDSQQFVENFIWNDIEFNSYFISFENCDRLFKYWSGVNHRFCSSYFRLVYVSIFLY